MFWVWFGIGYLILLIIEGMFTCSDLLPFGKDKSKRGDKANAKGKKHGKNQDAFDPFNSWHGYRKD